MFVRPPVGGCIYLWAIFLLGSVLHVKLAAKDDQHVGATVVEHPGPVVDHPCPRVLMDELTLKVEHVRVVGRHFDVHIGAVVLLGSL